MKQPFTVSPCTARLGWKYNSFLSSVLLNFLPLLLFSGQALRAAVAMEGAVRNEMAWHFVPFCKLHKIKMNLCTDKARLAVGCWLFRFPRDDGWLQTAVQ